MNPRAATLVPSEEVAQSPHGPLQNLVWQGEGPPLILVHGITYGPHCWAALARELGQGFHLVAPALRGHGDSAPAVPYPRMRDFVRDLRFVLRSLGLRDVAIVGHSLGASVALDYAASYPQDVRSLVLIEPPLPPYGDNARGGWAWRRGWMEAIGNRRMGWDSREEALERLLRSPVYQAWDREALDAFLDGETRPQPEGGLQWKWSKEQVLGFLEHERGRRLWALMPRVTASTMVVRAEGSPFFTEKIAQRATNAIHRARLQTFDCGHEVPMERPQVLAQILREFLSGQ